MVEGNGDKEDKEDNEEEQDNPPTHAMIPKGFAGALKPYQQNQDRDAPVVRRKLGCSKGWQYIWISR